MRKEDAGLEPSDGWVDEIEDAQLRSLLRAARGAHRELPEPEATEVLRRILAELRARPRHGLDSAAARWLAACAAAVLAAWAAMTPAHGPDVSPAPRIVKSVRFECARQGKTLRFEMTLRRVPEAGQEESDATAPSQ